MTPRKIRTPDASAGRERWTVPGGLSAAILWGCLWLPLLWRLQEAWEADPELMHGIAVPFMALYLGWQRWRTGGAELAGGSRSRVSLAVYGLGLLGVWGLMPVMEINALWPRAQWITASFAVVGSWGLLHWAWGTRGVKHFVFPVLFLLTALSWPSALRSGIVNTLAQAHAEWAAELVSLLGYPAVVRGNVIEVSSGLIGVEEACAGLRSLQAVWMFALFFGELHLLGWAARMRIIGVALGAALVGNVGRTLFLTWRIGVEGSAANEIWHDEAGLAVLIGTLVVVLGYAQWEAGRAARQAAPESGEQSEQSWTWPRIWAPVLIALALESALVEVVVQHWYARGQDVVVTKRWALRERPGEWTSVPVSTTTQDILLCTSAEQRQAEASTGTQALAAIFRWENDQKAASSLTNSHDPSVCMPAIGGRLLEPPGEVTLALGSRELVFDIYRFETQGRIQTVFNAVWDAMHGESMPRAIRGATTADERMTRVWTGQRYADRDRVVLVLEGDYSVSAAIAWLEREAPRLLQPTVGNQARG